MDATNAKLRETWDRLVLVLMTLPRERREREFREIACREILRLAPQEMDETIHDE